MKYIYLIIIVLIFSNCSNSGKNTIQDVSISDTINVADTDKKILYSINQKEVFPLTKPEGEKILNDKATKSYGYNYYYKLTDKDKVYIIEEKDGWVEVVHESYPQNKGWIMRDYLSEYIGRNNESIPQTTNGKVSSGYMNDKDFKPTIDPKGEYHTIDGKNKQIQYQGSLEQKKDLEEMEKRGW